jgi:hypothetical protein
VNRGIVPDHNDSPAKLFQDGAEECRGLERIKGVFRASLEIQSELAASGRKTQRRDHADLFAVGAFLFQNGRLSSRGQRAADQRRAQKTALVNQDDVCVFIEGFF